MAAADPAPAPLAPETAVTKGQLSPLSTIAPSPSNQERFLVVDTAAFIRGVNLERFGSTLCIVPEVLGEIKDGATRQRIAAYPVPVQQKEPTPDDIRVVTAFAKKTGDLAFLSVTDLKVLALTYMLHRQLEGVASLRTEPLPIASAPPKHSREPAPPREGRGGARGNRGGVGGNSNSASGAGRGGVNTQRGGRGGRGGGR